MNKLKGASSLYLQQHATNPVDWYPWCEEAFVHAKENDKLILVSIGYSSCHWCHVMEKESFEDTEIAKYMNEHFICIKVDREEHPEVDEYYMSALQAMTGQGGWPLNMFLTPAGDPFYGGTYFPPQPFQNRVSWLQVLMSLQKAWSTKNPEIEQTASSIQNFLNTENKISREEISWNEEEILKELKDKMKPNGGFTHTPKFPMLMTLDWMLSLAIDQEDKQAEAMVKNNLQEMLLGGIYDQAQGGLMRYSTDDRWLIPHFEKMLYTQAQLIPLLGRMHKRYPLERIWKYYLDLEMNFLKDWMYTEGAYNSSIDADTTEGEGFYYTYTKEEMQEVLEAEDILDMYGLENQGDFEGRYILHFTQVPDFGAWSSATHRFRDIQSHRIAPSIDTKKICSWNAYLAIGFARTYIYTEDVKFMEMFSDLFKTIRENYENSEQKESVLRLQYSNGDTIAGVAEDYALLALCYFYAFRFDQEPRFLERAKEIMEYVIADFEIDENISSATKESRVAYRAKSEMDDMLPNANSVFLELLQLSALLIPNESMLQKLRVYTERLESQVMQVPVYRSYAGKILSQSDKLQKVETNLSWSDIELPLPDSMWLYKMSKEEDEESRILLCTLEKCKPPIEGKEACKDFWKIDLERGI